MADVVMVVIVLAFFALALGLVRVCDRVIGPDELEADATDDGAVDAPEQVAA